MPYCAKRSGCIVFVASGSRTVSESGKAGFSDPLADRSGMEVMVFSNDVESSGFRGQSTGLDGRRRGVGLLRRARLGLSHFPVRALLAFSHPIPRCWKRLPYARRTGACAATRHPARRGLQAGDRVNCRRRPRRCCCGAQLECLRTRIGSLR